MHPKYDETSHLLVENMKNNIGFKASNAVTVKKPARRWDHRLSNESLSQDVSPLKDSAKTVNPSQMISLGAGRPTPLYYPWHSMAMIGTSHSRKFHQSTAANFMTCTRGETMFDLSSALDYADPCGSQELIAFFRETTQLIHNPPYQDWDTTLTCGSTSAIDIALRMFCNRGDWILTEEFTYAGTLVAAKAQSLKTQGIKLDEDGLVPEDLESILGSWDASRGRKPFVLYTIPSGHNPTGITQSTERKEAIYRIAERHDLLILEDDPYFFLRFPESSTFSDITPPHSQLNKLCESMTRSYLSLDRSGRVIRIESTSKILAPGLRCGWLIASRQIVDIYGDFAEVGPSSPSGPSQVMLYKLLVQNWGQQGLANWLNYLSGEYCWRRDAMIAACKQHLPRDVCTWTEPTHGMFLWITVDFGRHVNCVDIQSVEDGIYKRAEQSGVRVAKGDWFNAGRSANKAYFRMTFAATDSQDDLEKGVELFAGAIRYEFDRSIAE